MITGFRAWAPGPGARGPGTGARAQGPGPGGRSPVAFVFLLLLLLLLFPPQYAPRRSRVTQAKRSLDDRWTAPNGPQAWLSWAIFCFGVRGVLGPDPEL